MNELIKQQLEKCKVAKVEPFDDSTLCLKVPRYKFEAQSDPILGKCYTIELEKYIINPPEGFTLHTNWNNNIIPKYLYMNVEINRIMGKMYYIIGTALDEKTGNPIDYSWEGWLPRKGFHLLKEL